MDFEGNSLDQTLGFLHIREIIENSRIFRTIRNPGGFVHKSRWHQNVAKSLAAISLKNSDDSHHDKNDDGGGEQGIHVPLILLAHPVYTKCLYGKYSLYKFIFNLLN